MPSRTARSTARMAAISVLLLLSACIDDGVGPAAPTAGDASPGDMAYAVTAIATVTDLGNLGEYPTGTADMNANGWVVGSSRVTTCCSHGFLWQGTGSLVDLGSLYDVSSALAVSDNGVVVGWTETPYASAVAFRWTEAGGMEDLGTLGGALSASYDVNAAGAVVGYSTMPQGISTRHAFLWTDADGMVDLGVLPGTTSSEASLINDAGEVAGTSGTRAFIWQSGTMQDLGTLGGSSAAPRDLGEGGHVVGQSTTAGGVPHAFRWISGTMQDLGTLGGQQSGAEAVNATGVVVGWAHTAQGYSHAFLWTEGDGMTDLGTLGGLGSRALDVNDLGEVTGWALDETGARRAFIWTANAGMQELPGLPGLPSSEGSSINNARQIAGAGDNHALFWDDVSPLAQPVADAGGPYTGPEHAPIDFDASGSSSGDGGPLSYAWDFDLDGVTDATGVQASRTYGFPGTFVVRLTISDSVGLVRSDEATVTVTPDGWPSAVIAVPTSTRLPAVAEGQPIELNSAGSQSESGTPLLYRWEFGDGTVAQSRFQTTPFRWNKRYQDDGTYLVRLIVYDQFGGRDTAVTEVVVTNAPPRASGLAVQTVILEASIFPVALLSATDSSHADRAAGFEYSFDCDNGDGFSAWDTSARFMCRARPDEGLHTIRGRVRDKDGGMREYTASRTTRNHRPLVYDVTWEVTGTRTARVAATFSDPGIHDAPWRLVVLWGDGTRTYTTTNVQGTVRASHTYAANGPYEATVYVIDEDRGPASAPRLLSISF